MKHASLRSPFFLFLLLLGVSLCCLLGAEILRRDGGYIRIVSVRIPSGDGEGSFRGTLYLPESAGENSPAPGILLLHGGSSPWKTGGVWAAELARRGMAVLSCREAEAAGAAWQYLAGREEVLDGCMALAARGGSIAYACALAGEVSGTDAAPRAVVLLASQAEDAQACAESAAPLPNRLLLWSGGREDTKLLSRFLDVPAADGAWDETFGYFGEGSACRAEQLPPTAQRKAALLSAVDWFGSSLGHPNTLADENLIYGRWQALLLCSAASAALSLVPGTGALLGRRRRRQEAAR